MATMSAQGKTLFSFQLLQYNLQSKQDTSGCLRIAPGPNTRVTCFAHVKAILEETVTTLPLSSRSSSVKTGEEDATKRMLNCGKSMNIVWHKSPVGKCNRQQLLQQKGCVIWITGLSGSGKSTLACAVAQGLHSLGKFTYILDGDNVRHGLNKDLSFKAEDRAENIRRVGEVAKLFADAGVICIACLISPYRKDREGCRTMLPDGEFVEVYMNTPIEVCEARDSKGLYKMARAGKIKGFTGIDDPYEPPARCEIALEQQGPKCASPTDMAEIVINYLGEKGYLHA